eukprot:365594-Chlamydomonas_euryale.AAC.1
MAAEWGHLHLDGCGRGHLHLDCCRKGRLHLHCGCQNVQLMGPAFSPPRNAARHACLCHPGIARSR